MTDNYPSRRSVLKGIGAATIPALAGCSGGSGSGSGPIKFGILLAFSGELGSYGESESSGIEVGIDAINSAGGIHGRDMKSTTQDTEGQPQQAKTGFETLLNENIVAMYGPFSNSIPALLPSIKREQLPTFTSAGTTALDGKGGKYLFRPAGSDSDLGRARATFVRDQGWKRIATVALDTSNSKSAIGVLERAIGTFDDIEVVKSITVPTGASSYSSELSSVANANPDAVITTLGSEDAPLFIENYRDEGIGAPLMLGNDSVGVQRIVDEVGEEAMEGITGFRPGSAGNFENFAQRYNEYHGTDEPAPYAHVAYDSITVVGLAAEAADTPNSKGIVNNIQKVAKPGGTKVASFEEGKKLLDEGKEINYQGASSACNFNASGDGFPPLVVQKFTDGEWTDIKEYKQSDIAVSKKEIAE